MVVSNNMKKEWLIHLSTIHRQQCIERRGWEWRVFLTEVSLLVLTIVLVVGQRVSLTGKAWAVSLFAVVTAVPAIFYLSQIHAASNSDKNFAEEAEDCLNLSCAELEAYVEANGSIYAAAKRKNRNPSDWKSQFGAEPAGTWSFRFQAGIIIVTAVFVSFVAHVMLSS